MTVRVHYWHFALWREPMADWARWEPGFSGTGIHDTQALGLSISRDDLGIGSGRQVIEMRLPACLPALAEWAGCRKLSRSCT